jgi:hypothetical protein
VQCALLLNVVISKGAPILKLFAREDETLEDNHERPTRKTGVSQQGLVSRLAICCCKDRRLSRGTQKKAHGMETKGWLREMGEFAELSDKGSPALVIEDTWGAKTRATRF